MKKDISILNIRNHKDWLSSWYINKNEYFHVLQEDIILYSYLRSKLRYFLINSIKSLKLSRILNLLIIVLKSKKSRFNSKFIFREKKSILKLRKNILLSFLANVSKFFKKSFFLSTFCILYSRSVLNSSTLALKIARLIEKRTRFRSWLIKKLIRTTKRRNNGIYVECTGRINNADRARSIVMQLGSVPFQSFNELIEYSFAVANTAKGLQNIKIWLYKKNA